MALPFLLIPAAIALGALGAKKGYDGYQKNSRANEIVDDAKNLYHDAKDAFDGVEQEANKSLEAVGNTQLKIGKKINEFKKLADKLIKELDKSSNKDFKISIPKHELDKVDDFGFTAVGVIGTLTGAGAAGAAAGFAVYGGVMALGAASTGTVISTLSGVAATNATLAAIGGGSLATGGLGMAGGTAILGGAVAAPVLLVAGWAYDKHGEASLNNAHKAAKEAEEAVHKLSESTLLLNDVVNYSNKINNSLNNLFNKFKLYYLELKDLNDKASSLDNKSYKEYIISQRNEIIEKVENGYMLASIMVDIIKTPIFKMKVDKNNQTITENNTPILETDLNGNKQVNKNNLLSTLKQADDKISNLF